MKRLYCNKRVQDMGVHDYSCFVCSDEGEQNLSIWDDTLLDDELPYEEMMCTYPPQESESNSVGPCIAYLLCFNKEISLSEMNEVKEAVEVDYCCDGWN